MSEQSEPKASEPRHSSSAAARMALLLLISIFGLYLELVVIRWVGTEVRIFAYLQNTVLVVCFLGLGMGAWTSRRPFSIRWLLLSLFLLVALLAMPATRIMLGRISGMLGGVGGLLIWYGADDLRFRQELGLAVLGLALTFLMMVLIWSVFVPIGRLIGRLLDEHQNTIWAYSVNVAGSLAGIWLFVLLSGLHQPPLMWLAVGAAMALVLLVMYTKSWWIDVALLAGIVALGWFAAREPGADAVVWSPYQKLAMWSDVEGHDPYGKWRPKSLREQLFSGKRDFGVSIGDYLVTVNNVGYQAMIDLSPQRVESNPTSFLPEMRGYSQYDLPTALHPDPRSVLIVGAGAGNDAAGALRGGAEEVIAVEIDPAIIDLGRRYHPERPYDSPRVEVVIDDARSYFATTERKFDVIAFGLLDSHTTTAMTNARLDHYVYTRESIQRAKDLLADGGIMVLSFEAQKAFIADRLARVLGEVFGAPPKLFRVPYTHYGWGGVFFVTGDLEAVERSVAQQPELEALLASWSRGTVDLTYTTKIATDDWPYLYLESPHIPVLYYMLAAMMLVLFLLGVLALRAPTMITRWKQSEWHFFWLGAAFMLLEVQNISKAAVVLGNTWEVNAVIISAILMMILVANWIASRLPRLPLLPVYMLLCGTCLALYFVDLSAFAFLAYPVKAVLVGALVSLPMLFSGIVFIRSFSVMPRKDAALAANLMGALVGGLLQSVTFVTGIKALLLIVAGLYLLALFTRPRAVRQAEGYSDEDGLGTPEGVGARAAGA